MSRHAYSDIPSPIDFHDLDQARAWVVETVRKRPSRPRFFAAFSTALSRAAAGPIDVLELGSGPGHLAREILTRCRIATYVALDFSGAMSQLAREHLAELSAGVTFVQRDFRDPRWTVDLGLFDAVVTMQAAHETRHRRYLVPLLRQVRSVLKPGGLLLYCDHYFEPGGGKNPLLYLERVEQPVAMSTAGFSRVRLLHDEGGMALYVANAELTR